MSKQDKPATSFNEQLAILKRRGLSVSDDQFALSELARFNYYRLRGYYIHLFDNDLFYPGTSFEQLHGIYSFDADLRAILLQLVFDIELAYRTRIAYVLGHAWGPLGYLDLRNYRTPPALQPQLTELLAEIEKNIDRSKELFIKAHRVNGGKAICPIWVGVETMGFADLSKIFTFLPPDIKKKIAAFTPQVNHIAVGPRIHCAVVLRNLCAHNCRIYNRHMALRVKFSKDEEETIATNFQTFTVAENTLFATLIVLRSITPACPWNKFIANITLLFSKYKGKFDMGRIGFPLGWVNVLGNKTSSCSCHAPDVV